VRREDALKYPPKLVHRFLRGFGWTVSKAFWFVRFRGTANIPAPNSGGYVIAANHQTYLDPMWICIPISQKLQFMAFDEAFEWRLVGPMIRSLGAFPVSLEGKGVLRSMKQSLRALEDGAALVVFPEGGRQLADGEMMPFKEGVVRIAMQAGVPILPVTITGGNRIWPRGQSWPRLFRRLTVTYHPLMHPGEDDDPELVTQKLRDVIASAG
jgi:1-acyl-sn-glycerol-3-phosphate acyltransferase